MYGSSPLCGQDLNKVRPAPERKSTLKHVDEYQDFIKHIFLSLHPIHWVWTLIWSNRFYHHHCLIALLITLTVIITLERPFRAKSRSRGSADIYQRHHGHSSQIPLWFKCSTWFVMGLKLTQKLIFIRVILSHKSSFLISFQKYHMQSLIDLV